MLTTLLLCLSAVAQQPDALLSSTTRTLPALGATFVDERVLESTTGRILRRTVDARGVPVDGDALLVAEARARDGASGKVSPELQARLQAGGEVRVVFWLARSGEHVDSRQALRGARAQALAPEEARKRALAVAATETARLTAPFSALLRAEGHRVAYVDPYVPIVFVDLPAAAVPALARRDEVDQAYFAFPQLYHEGTFTPIAVAPNDRASPTARTDAVHRRGITGAGVKVLVNDAGDSIVDGNPNLPPIVRNGSYAVGSHATAVAGMIASRHATYGGAAPGLTQLFDSNAYSDTGCPASWAWGMSQGISFGNCSWWNGNRGSIVFLDRYFDYIIRAFGVMLFKSAGNQGLTNPTTSPGNGYNCIASGCFNERDTHDWNDDVMSSFSSAVNPTPGHEKPEVAAPGDGITSTTTSSPWTGSTGSGTSYASPVTCGTGVLLAATRSELLAEPEAIKALIMAGAWHNIEGAAALSGQDGAGGVDAAASQDAAAKQQYHLATLTAASFVNNEYTVNLPLLAGDETRVCAVWFSEADSAYATDTLRMDLDLSVERPGGGVVATSASALNAFEIASFVPPVTGTYVARLTRQRFQGTSEPFALAWSTRRNAATDLVTVVGTPTIGTTAQIEFFDRYHPGAAYVALASLTPFPATIPVAPNKILPLGFDGLSYAAISGALPGFTGTLAATGRATGSIPIPNLTPLRGLQVHLAMATLDLSLPELVEDTSEATSFTIQ